LTVGLWAVTSADHWVVHSVGQSVGQKGRRMVEKTADTWVDLKVHRKVGLSAETSAER